jgi:hypothetical protein
VVVDEATLDAHLAELNAHRVELIAELNHTVGAIDAVTFLKAKLQAPATEPPAAPPAEE